MNHNWHDKIKMLLFSFILAIIPAGILTAIIYEGTDASFSTMGNAFLLIIGLITILLFLAQLSIKEFAGRLPLIVLIIFILLYLIVSGLAWYTHNLCNKYNGQWVLEDYVATSRYSFAHKHLDYVCYADKDSYQQIYDRAPWLYSEYFIVKVR